MRQTGRRHCHRDGSAVRRHVKQGLRKTQRQHVGNELSGVLFGHADFPVSCSILGDGDPAITRPDGTEAEYFLLRPVDQNVTRQYIETAGGQLVLGGARLGGKMSLSVVAYQPGGRNTKADLRELLARTLAEFELTGVIE